jgi:HEAT repeat protein
LEALAHPSAAARGLAVVLLGQPGASAHVEPLVSVLAGDAAPRVRAQAAQALGRIGDARARAALQQAAADPGQPSDVRAAARAALSQLRGAP